MRSFYWTLFIFSIACFVPGIAYAQTLPKAEYVCNFKNPDPQDQSGDSVVYRCRPRAGDNAPEFLVAVLKGTPSEINRAHGYLLARETQIGPLRESLDLVNFGLSQHSFLIRPSLENVVTCFSDNLFNSLTAEFRTNVEAFEQGYRQRLKRGAKYSRPELHLAATGIELDNVMTAVAYRHDTLGQLVLAEDNCRGDLLLKVIYDGGLKLVGKDKGLGCTAFAVPEKGQNGTILSKDGLVFGRTLDAELMRSWNTVPTLFIVHEKGQDEDGRPYLSYVATGSAGLIYPGGITGYNTEGITVSLHQMYASDVVLSVPSTQRRKAALAPVIEQTILREARSIADAVKIAARYQAIATWTILIADSKTGEAAAIEITKAGVKLVRQTRHQPLAQTNHVFDPVQQAYAFFPNYNKYNETHTRMITLEKAFARVQKRAAEGQPFTASQAITQLANHDDINGHFQPFGTTSVKAYDVMSTVLLPQAHKVYMSAGDFSPSPHATFLGFQLDRNLNPVASLGTLRDQTLAGTPGVLQSLHDYVEARLAYEAKNYPEAERLIRQAIGHASDEAANGADPAFADRKAGSLRIYDYILARLLAMKASQELDHKSWAGRLFSTKTKIRAAAYAEARLLFEAVIKDRDALPYQRALAEYYYGLAELKGVSRRGNAGKLSPETAAYVQDALSVFQTEYEALKPSVEIKQMAIDIDNMRKVLDAAKNGVPATDDIDWVVMR